LLRIAIIVRFYPSEKTRIYCSIFLLLLPRDRVTWEMGIESFAWIVPFTMDRHENIPIWKPCSIWLRVPPWITLRFCSCNWSAAYCFLLFPFTAGLATNQDLSSI
jgi:hypothetical protein